MEEKVLVLRCCFQNGVSFRGFKWPTSGPVECPDWDPKRACGNGLHGWLWGSGNARLSNADVESTSTLWLVVEVLKSDIVDLDGKVKFPRGNVIYCGNRETAVKMITAKAPQNTLIMFQDVMCESNSAVTCGDYSKVIAGHYSVINSGSCANIIAKSHSNINVGGVSTVSVGFKSDVKVGKYSNVNAGNWCRINAGNCSNIIAGEFSTVKAGNGSNLIIAWWCSMTCSTGFATATFASVPSHGQLSADVAYKVRVEDGIPKFVEVPDFQI